MANRLTQGVASAFFHAFATGVFLIGLGLLGIGGLLAARGGSPFYAVSGALLIASGVQLFRRRGSASHLAAFVFIITWAWALWEVGLDGWALLPRVDVITVLLPFYALPAIRGRLRRTEGRTGALDRFYPAGVLVVLIAASAAVALRPMAAVAGLQAPSRQPAEVASSGDWKHIGQDVGGARFVGLSEINRQNAKDLKRVWTYSATAGGAMAVAHRDEATPIQADGKLFVCMGDNTVVALDAEDGRLLWRHDPQVNLKGVLTGICRGVAYYQIPATASAGDCPKRILLGTLDARLIALDAETGAACASFGNGGEVSLKEGLGAVPPGQYYSTSPPVIVRGIAVVGALVQDNQSVDEPSGVIRGFDARTGKLAWAWDLGRPPEKGPPSAAETYTRGTPNAWSPLSADEALGLVYIPTGNATPDYVGSHRKDLWEKYSSSIVALDVATGQVRWSFQFVHHDLWDYDTAAQPVLFDMPTAQGMVPALLQATKGGQLFVFDRRDGAPLSAIVEKPTPQTDVPGEWTSRTQPFSVGMPDVGGPPLREKDMWGVSPFDQMLCRLKFRRLRYEGVFTPPSIGGALSYPSQLGGVDWGSVTIDKSRDLLIAPSTRLATVTKLIPRAEADKRPHVGYVQAGTPYAVDTGPFMTALQAPCQQPPYALLTAIDLRTKAVVWSRPLGLADEIGPFGLSSHLPFTIGAPPVVGGAVATSGGVIFIGAVGDRRLRAIDSLTGRELWSEKLPAGNQATPISYRAPRSGRQMVVIVSGASASLVGSGEGGGANAAPRVVAFALR